VLSDKQRGLLPAIQTVFPNAKHALCQSHYLKNIAEPIAAADDTMKVKLRKRVRRSIGQTIRAEQEEQPGVLTVTGLLPSGLESKPSVADREQAELQRQLSPAPEEEEKKRGTSPRGRESRRGGESRCSPAG
jgi:transposase-like protein